MKNISSAFKSEKNKSTNQPVVLFIVHDYDGAGNNLRFADYDSDVTFDGQTYTKFPIKFQTLDENTNGQIDALRVTLGNVSRLIQAYLESGDLRDKKITIRIVWANLLADATSYLDYIYYIDSYESNQENAEFICTTRMDVIDMTIPGGIYLRTHCRYKTFKDPDTCGYAGSETDCNRTMQRCKELDNFQRFGGFPALPLRRLYVA